MQVEGLIALGGPPPKPVGHQPTPDEISTVVNIYKEIYMDGIARFFESNWFRFRGEGTDNPLSLLTNDTPLVSMFLGMLESFADPSSAEPGQAECMNNVETHTIWALCGIARNVPEKSKPATPPKDYIVDEAIESRNRFHVFETLLSGSIAPSNPLLAPEDMLNTMHNREVDFWYTLAKYTTQTLPEERRQTLAQLRTKLEGLENRDILISIAILREYVGEFEHASDLNMPLSLNASDPKHQHHVAAKYLRTQARNTGGGSFNVFRRFAVLGTRAFGKDGACLNWRQEAAERLNEMSVAPPHERLPAS